MLRSYLGDSHRDVNQTPGWKSCVNLKRDQGTTETGRLNMCSVYRPGTRRVGPGELCKVKLCKAFKEHHPVKAGESGGASEGEQGAQARARSRQGSGMGVKRVVRPSKLTLEVHVSSGTGTVLRPLTALPHLTSHLPAFLSHRQGLERQRNCPGSGSEAAGSSQACSERPFHSAMPQWRATCQFVQWLVSLPSA